MSTNLFSTPKTNWVVGDGLQYIDANRQENNTEAMRDALIKPIFGFGFHTTNDATNKGLITIYSGGLVTEGGYPIKTSVTWTKNLGAWTTGNGATYGGVVSGASIAAHTWLYAFIVLDPSTGNTELMIDSSRAGVNISSATYTEKRLVNAFKTGAVNSPTYDVVEMYSVDGDRVYINPDSLLPSQHWLTFSNTGGVGNNNYYNSITLSDATYGALLPNLEVDVRLQMQIDTLEAIGFIQDNSGVFTVPSQLLVSSYYTAEWYWLDPGTGVQSVETELNFRAGGIIYLAMYHSTLPAGGHVDMVPISYKWYRKQYGV